MNRTERCYKIHNGYCPSEIHALLTMERLLEGIDPGLANGMA